MPILVVAWLLLFGTPADRVQDECARLASAELESCWRAIDEIIQAEARKPWGEQRPLAGLGCLANLEPSSADEVLLDLLEAARTSDSAEARAVLGELQKK
jgi:hypothetical protein